MSKNAPNLRTNVISFEEVNGGGGKPKILRTSYMETPKETPNPNLVELVKIDRVSA